MAINSCVRRFAGFGAVGALVLSLRYPFWAFSQLDIQLRECFLRTKDLAAPKLSQLYSWVSDLADSCVLVTANVS